MEARMSSKSRCAGMMVINKLVQNLCYNLETGKRVEYALKKIVDTRLPLVVMENNNIHNLIETYLVNPTTSELAKKVQEYIDFLRKLKEESDEVGDLEQGMGEMEIEKNKVNIPDVGNEELTRCENETVGLSENHSEAVFGYPQHELFSPTRKRSSVDLMITPTKKFKVAGVDIKKNESVADGVVTSSIEAQLMEEQRRTVFEERQKSSSKGIYKEISSLEDFEKLKNSVERIAESCINVPAKTAQ